MQFITNLLTKIDELVWGLPLIMFISGNWGIFNFKVKVTSNIQITTSFKIRIWKR